MLEKRAMWPVSSRKAVITAMCPLLGRGLYAEKRAKMNWGDAQVYWYGLDGIPTKFARHLCEPEGEQILGAGGRPPRPSAINAHPEKTTNEQHGARRICLAALSRRGRNSEPEEQFALLLRL
jgi:hypothetical protein